MDLLNEYLFWLITTFVSSYCVIRLYKALCVILHSIYIHLICDPINISYYMSSYTLVTGATGGIGRAMVYELAKSRGIKKFYLIGRSEKKLAEIKADLEFKFKAHVKTTIFNFESMDYSDLPTDLKTLKFGILINCAGIGPGVGTLLEQEEGLPTKIVRVNLMGPLKLIEIVGARMIKRKLGVIINVSSFTCWRPLPYLSSYPAAKAAISFFSKGMSDELRGKFVKVQCLSPLFVATKAASYEKSEASCFVVSTEEYARQAVKCLGLCDFTTGCYQHDIQVALGNLIPPPLFKALYVPFVILGIHKKRVKNFRQRHAYDDDDFY